MSEHATLTADRRQADAETGRPVDPAALVSVRGLRVVDPAGSPVVDGVDLDVRPGESVALVGESGAGKTLTVKAVAGLLPTGVTIADGTVLFDGAPLPDPASPDFRTRVRPHVGYVFQDPMVALHPLQTTFRQISDAVDPDRSLPAAERNRRTWELFDLVALKDPETTARKIPSELSGGMCQRVVIAIAVARRPRLLVADEPTTALDVTVQAQILDLLTDLRTRLGAALLLVSHDLGLVARYAQRVNVFRDGQIVESGETTSILQAPEQEYTRSLLASTPLLSSPRPNEALLATFEAARSGGPGPDDDVVLEGTALTKSFPATRRGKARATVVSDVSVRALAGEAVGIVGESGSGKSTLVNLLAGVLRPDSGLVTIDGTPAWGTEGRVRVPFGLGGPRRALGSRRARAQVAARARRAAQLAFQDAWGSLDPFLSVADSIAEPLRVEGRLEAAAREDAVASLLAEVGLARELGDRLPSELSGGQRQRAGIARALALDPRILFADEPVSALDVSVQARIVDLLARLQRDRGTTLVLVSHDLAVVRLLTSYLYVMRDGRVVEEGPTSQVVANPQHPFTVELVRSIPGSPAAPSC